MSNNFLITYFTHSGNTRKIAKLIQDGVGGDVFEIQPKIPYPDCYNTVVEQAKKEIREGFKPALKSKIHNIESYDIIFIGSPNWWSTLAPPVAALLSENDLSGKTVAPFCTHGGGGLGRIGREIMKLCPKSIILDSFEIYGSGGGTAQSKVTVWLHRIGLI